MPRNFIDWFAIFLKKTIGEVDHSLYCNRKKDKNNRSKEQPAIDDIAIGFMVSKAFSVALEIDLFDAIGIMSK